MVTFSSLCGRHLPIWKPVWLPRATAGAGGRCGVCIVSEPLLLPACQPLLATAALQEFMLPVLYLLHYDAAAPVGF